MINIFISIGFTILALFLRFKCLLNRELWNDEVYQLSRIAGPFQPFWERHAYGDMTTFPGEYIITYPCVLIFGDNKWGINASHILLTIIGFYFLYKLCSRYFKTPMGFVVTFAIVALNQHLIFHAFEFRPYGVLVTLSIIVFYYLNVLFDQWSELTKINKIAFGMFFGIISLFHPYSILIVSFPALYLLLVHLRKENNRKIFEIFNYLLIVLLIVLPFWIYYATGNPLGITKEVLHSHGKTTFQFIPHPAESFNRFFNYVFLYYLIGIKRLYFLLGGLILLIVVPFKNKKSLFLFFPIVIFLPIMLILAADLYNGYWFLIRQYIYLAPMLAFFLGWIWDRAVNFYVDPVQRQFTPRSILGFIVMVGCFSAGMIGLILYI